MEMVLEKLDEAGDPALRRLEQQAIRATAPAREHPEPGQKAMARLPLDPRLSRALLESQRFHAESELLAIVSGLSVPDVRLGDDPADGATFDDSKSEFSALLKLWRAYRAAREGPRRELRRWCKEHHLSVLRLSEWDDVYTQVVDRARELGLVAA